MAVLADAPKAPPWKWCVAKPELLSRLRAELPAPPKPYLPEGLYGMSLYPKQQVADAWMFRDEKILRKYLNDELTELDLLELVRTGACQPNDPAGGGSHQRMVRCCQCGHESEDFGIKLGGELMCWGCYNRWLDNALSKLSPAQEKAPNDKLTDPRRAGRSSGKENDGRTSND